MMLHNAVYGGERPLITVCSPSFLALMRRSVHRFARQREPRPHRVWSQGSVHQALVLWSASVCCSLLADAEESDVFLAVRDDRSDQDQCCSAPASVPIAGRASAGQRTDAAALQALRDENRVLQEQLACSACDSSLVACKDCRERNRLAMQHARVSVNLHFCICIFFSPI